MNMLAISEFKPVRKILKLGKKELRIRTIFGTGHGSFKARLKLFKIINDDTCRFCKEYRETAEHILCECPIFQYQKGCITNWNVIIDPSQWKIYEIEKLLDFLKTLQEDVR